MLDFTIFAWFLRHMYCLNLVKLSKFTKIFSCFKMVRTFFVTRFFVLFQDILPSKFFSPHWQIILLDLSCFFLFCVFFSSYFCMLIFCSVQVHLNKLECSCKSESETFIYFRFIACKVKHFKRFFFCFNFDD